MTAGVTYEFQPVAYVNRGSISQNKLQIGPGDLSQRNLLAEGMPGVRGFLGLILICWFSCDKIYNSRV